MNPAHEQDDEAKAALEFLENAREGLATARAAVAEANQHKPSPLTAEWANSMELLMKQLTFAYAQHTLAETAYKGARGDGEDERGQGGGGRDNKRPHKQTPLPTGGPKFELSATTTEKNCADFFVRARTFLAAQMFPREEPGPNGQPVHRWTGFLATHVVNPTTEDLQFLGDLVETNVDWDTACWKFTKRFARARDPLQATAYLCGLRQGQMAASSFIDKVRVAVSTSVRGGGDAWVQHHPVYTWLLIKGLRSDLRTQLVADPAYEEHASSYDEMAKLIITVERRMLSRSLFSENGGAGEHKGESHAHGGFSKSNKKESKSTNGGGAGSPKNKQSTGSQRHEHKGASSSAEDREQGKCERCNKPGHNRNVCRSEFHANSTRLSGKPPGAGPDWRPSKKKCNSCGAADHLESGCQRVQRAAGEGKRASEQAAPAVRAMHVLGGADDDTRMLTYDPSQAEPEGMNHTGPAIRALGTGGFGYGCGLCGDQHSMHECPLNTSRTRSDRGYVLRGGKRLKLPRDQHGSESDEQ